MQLTRDLFAIAKFLFYIIFAVLIKYILPTFQCRCQPSYKISSKYLNPRHNYNNFFEIQDGGPPLSWIFDNLILSNRSPWVALFHHCTNFGEKMLIDAEIMANNRNQDGGRPPSWICYSSYRTTHEVFSLGHIGSSNFMLIRWRYDDLNFFADLAWNAYIHAPKILVFGV